MKSLLFFFFLINMYIKVYKIELIWLNCQLGGLLHYEKAKITLEIEKTIDFSFYIFLVLCANFFWLTIWYIPCCFCTCNKILNFFFIFIFGCMAFTRFILHLMQQGFSGSVFSSPRKTLLQSYKTDYCVFCCFL